jgi:threonine dehydratase
MPLAAIEILKAQKNLRGITYETPLTYSQRLSDVTNAEIYLKWENLQKTGSFKLRGAYNKIGTLTPAEQKRGVITASAGNHAIAVAYVAQLLAIKAMVVLPETASIMKIDCCRSLKAEVVIKGAYYDEALMHCQEIMAKRKAIYIPSSNDDAVIAGQGTIGCEILEEKPEIETILVPVGGGGLISGIALWVKTVNPKIRVIGVQSTAAHTMAKCYSAKRLVSVPFLPTLADGLAGGISEKTLDLTLKYVDEMLLAKEEHLLSTILWILRNEHQLIEGSSAVGPALLIDKLIALHEGEKIAVIISGGNVDTSLLGLGTCT